MRTRIRNATIALTGASLTAAILVEQAEARFIDSRCHYVYQGFVAGLGAIYKLVCY